MVNRRALIILILFAISFILIAFLRLIAGTDQWGISDDEYINALRFRRVWTGSLVGASLAIAGVLLQSLLRNPLAAPDLMGLSAGAGFAVTLTIFMTGATLSVGGASIPALIGAVTVLALVYTLSKRQGVIDPVTMILIGVIVSVILGAATMLVAAQMPDRGFGTSRWMMGNLREDLSTTHLLVSSIAILIVLSLAVFRARSYDAGALPNDEAASVGLNIKRIRLEQLLGAGILTTISIILAGPIGFVGLVCPHIVRVLIGPRHNTLLIASTILGASMVVGSDVVTRAVETDAGRIPIGVLTALIGGPAFLVLLLKQRTSQSIN
jgi:iron complex transport system permease protein